MNNIKEENPTDLKYFGELERHLYGGIDSFSYFNREQVKCKPLSQSHLEISKRNGTSNFGYSWFSIVNNENGDYLTNCWLHVKIPEIKLSPKNSYGDKGVIRWTENLLHNLIDDFKIMVNDRVIYQLNNFALDLITQFCIDNDKFDKYSKNIGNIPELTNPSTILPSKELFLPLPLFFSKDTGLAIPLSSIPYTELKFNFKFKNWDELLIFENSASLETKPELLILGKDIDNSPNLEEVKLYGEFIIVSEEERKKLSIINKTIIFEQVQISPRQMITGNTASMDLLFKHSIKSLFFAVRNSTYKNVWSNYTFSNRKFSNEILVDYSNEPDIINKVSIKYDEKFRLKEMPSIFFKEVNPWYHSKRIPSKNGIYTFNFCLDQASIEPSGGISFNKISNPTINLNFNDKISNSKDTFELIVVAISNNILNISEGIINMPLI